MVSKSIFFASNSPIISSKVKTKSISLRTLFRLASSFFAAHGPINTTLESGCFILIKRPVKTIGVNVMDIQSLNSGNCCFAITDQAGQQEVPINGNLDGTFSIKSFASSVAHKSAPTATSITSANPNSFIAARNFPGVTFGPNCPTKAGATAAYTRCPSFIACINWNICPLSTIAPNGQFTRHIPQETHLSSRIFARPCSSLPIAFTPHACSQGRVFLVE